MPACLRVLVNLQHMSNITSSPDTASLPCKSAACPATPAAADLVTASTAPSWTSSHPRSMRLGPLGLALSDSPSSSPVSRLDSSFPFSPQSEVISGTSRSLPYPRPPNETPVCGLPRGCPQLLGTAAGCGVLQGRCVAGFALPPFLPAVCSVATANVKSACRLLRSQLQAISSPCDLLIKQSGELQLVGLRLVDPAGSAGPEEGRLRISSSSTRRARGRRSEPFVSAEIFFPRKTRVCKRGR